MQVKLALTALFLGLLALLFWGSIAAGEAVQSGYLTAAIMFSGTVVLELIFREKSILVGNHRGGKLYVVLWSLIGIAHSYLAISSGGIFKFALAGAFFGIAMITYMSLTRNSEQAVSK